MMSRFNAIVIMIDRLGADWLGPYGNTWIETPAFNRLASQSLLWEQMIATEPTLAGAYRCIGTGRHPFLPGSSDSFNLWNRMQQGGIVSTLITDELGLSKISEVSGFGDRIECAWSDSPQAADSVEQTQLARIFSTAMEWLDQPRDPFCLWLHARGLQGAWDAPWEFREGFADAEDPRPPDFVEAPNHPLPADADPDVLLGITQAHAAQITLLDMCLEMFLELLADRGLSDNTLLILTSPRGFPLGEHGHVGPSGDALHEELIHVPLLIRRPDHRYAMERNQTLVQPADLTAALCDWFQLIKPTSGWNAFNLLAPVETNRRPQREFVASMLSTARSIRTPAWFMYQHPDEPPQLFAKPDDRWEVNEVAGRCVETVEQLTSALHQFEELAHADRLLEMPGLPESLLDRED